MTSSTERAPLVAPSLAVLATERIQRAILSGRYSPGQRLTEESLSAELGVSRPPVREALKTLSLTGLVEHEHRKGSRVTPLTQHDVYEIVTLRKELEMMTLRLSMPHPEPTRVQRCRDRLADMEALVETGDEVAMILAGFEFHIALVGLAGHRRVEDSYRRLAMQLQLCMAMNNRARRTIEDLAGNVERHRRLLDVTLGGDFAEAALELQNHGDTTFLLQVVDTLPGATPQSQEWLRQLRQSHAPVL